MTFIISIQLNDSIIVTTDNKKVVLDKTGNIQFDTQKINKMHSWEKGIITGTGEIKVITRSVELFQEIAKSNIEHLPQCLEISRRIREFEVGTNNFQIENTKLLCSCYTEYGAQLYTIQRDEPLQPYEIHPLEPLDIIVWLFNPNIEAISEDLSTLYSDLQDYAYFANQTDWIQYYINRIAPIYQKQSQEDQLMSQSFDCFFQNKDGYVFGHITNENIHN